MTEVIERCTRSWRRLGVERVEIEAMVEELSSDLAEAQRDGLAAMEFVGGDPAGFARAWASARGVVRSRWRLASTTILALAAMVPAAAMALMVPLAITSPWFISMVQPSNPTLTCPMDAAEGCGDPYLDVPTGVLLLAYALALSAGYVFVLLAVSAWLRRCADPGRIATVRLLAFTLPIGLVVVGFVSRAYDNSFGRGTVDGRYAYENSWLIVFTLLVVALVAGTRWYAVKAQRRQSVPHHDANGLPAQMCHA